MKNRYEVECLSHSKKSRGYRIFYADNIEQVKEYLKKVRIKVFDIKEIKIKRLLVLLLLILTSCEPYMEIRKCRPCKMNYELRNDTCWQIVVKPSRLYW